MLRGLREKLRPGANVADQSAHGVSAEGDRYGLFSLVDESSEVPGYDIVAVHGLGGAYDKTWTADNGSFWLKDFLPVDAAHARIFSYGYDSSTFFSRGVTRIEDEALILLNRIYGARSTPEQQARPICFVGHSLGGIVIKKSLILANENVGRFGDLLQHVQTVIFFGVPHRGADIAFWGHFAAGITKIARFGLSTNDRFVKDLEATSSVLGDISTQFVHRAAELKQVYTYFETAKLNGILIVDQKSARLNVSNEIPDAINDADHRSICKFQRLESQSYIAVRQCFQELQRGLQARSSNEEEEEVATAQALRHTLAFPSMDDRYYAIDPPVAGTCEWLFHENDFQVWRNPKPNEPLSDRLLWLKANAGAGKSTLMKAMYDNSKQQASSYTLCYFFNARSPGQALDNSFCGMLRNLLWRLLTYDLSLLSVTPELRELKPQKRTLAESWHLNELKDLFPRCLRKVQGYRVYLYIDALDECPENQARAAIRFLEALAEEIDVVRLLFSSRFCPFISHKGREIEMEPHTAPDIWKYIDTHLPLTVDGQSSQSLRTFIGTRSSGIFLWTVLTVHEVVQANDRSLTHRQIQDLVEKIPLDLELMIEDMVRKIDPFHRSKACLIFNWVLLASDAPDPLEVFAMTRFDPQNPAANDASQWQSDFATMKRAIRTFSGGLLEVKSTMPLEDWHAQRSYVQFIHESVRDHLQTSKSLRKLLTGSRTFELIPNHTSLAEFCVEYIGQIPGFRDRHLDRDEMAKLLDVHADVFQLMCAYTPCGKFYREEVRLISPFVDVTQALILETSNVDQSTEECDRLSKYLADETWFPDFVELVAYVRKSHSYLHKALDFRTKYDNLCKSVKLLAPLKTRKTRGSRHRIHGFIEAWHHDAMRSMYRLLKTPFPLLPRTMDEVFLHLSLAQDDTAVKRLTAFLVIENPVLKVNILESMIRVSNLCSIRDQLDSYTMDPDHSYKCAPTERSEPMWQHQALARLAAGYGLRSLLERLLVLSPRDCYVQDPDGWCPLDHAFKNGCVSTSALLLQKGAKVDMNRCRGSAASAIMKNGTKFAKELISNLAESQALTSILGKLLVSSVCASEPELIEYLSKSGADLNVELDDGRDVLILASRLDNIDSEAVINVLLRHGASPHCADRFGRTALHYLSTRPDCEAVETLLRGMANINTADQTGQTPLDLALTFGNDDVAILLRSYGATSSSSAATVHAREDLRPPTSESSDEWVIDSDQGSAPWESDSAD